MWLFFLVFLVPADFDMATTLMKLKSSPRLNLESSSAWKLGLAITLLQFVWVFLFALNLPGSTKDRYLALNNWDSRHFIQIATHGYTLPKTPITSDDIHSGRANAVFFPGLPLAARALSRMSGASIPVSLLLIAQLSSWIFWTYFILLLRTYRVPRRMSRFAVVSVAIHPAAFFMVTGYTEAPFLAFLAGFIYWTERWHRNTAGGLSWEWFMSAFHGAALSTIRIVSWALALFPVFTACHGRFRKLMPSRESMRDYFWAWTLGLSVTVGGLAFFYFCHQQFNQWDIYFRLQEIGWDNQKKWFALFNPLTYVPRFFFEHAVESFNRASVTYTLILFAIAYSIERKRGYHWRDRFGLYFAAFFLFYIPLTGKANTPMDSMIRYTLPTHVLMVFALTLIRKERARSLFSKKMKWLVYAGGLFSIVLQAWFIVRFLHGRWVA